MDLIMIMDVFKHLSSRKKKELLPNYLLLYKKKYPVDFDDELKIGDVRYDNMT